MFIVPAELMECVFCSTAAIRRCTCSRYSWTSLYIITGITEGFCI